MAASRLPRALHDTLLRDPPEQRATLWSVPTTPPPKPPYHSWGWTKFGELQPFPDAPVFDAMILDLRK